MDRMSMKDILIVGIPNVSILLLFGIFLYQKDYFKDKNKWINILKLVISTIFILWTLTYVRILVQNILYVGLISLVLYAVTLIIIWKLNIRSALFCSIIIVFLSSSTENVYTPLFLKLSKESNIFIQSRFLMSLPIEITQILVTLMVYYGRINIGNLYLFKSNWNQMSLSSKVTTLLLMIFALTGFIIACSYTDILIKEAVFKIDVTMISSSIKFMFYGVLLLIFSGLFIISRTRSYEEIKQEVKNIKDAFALPPEQLFLNILQASKPEDIPKYQEVFTNYIGKGGESNEK